MLTKWEFIFVQLCAWRLHPGYLREGTKVPSLQDIALEADRIHSVCEVRLWRSEQQSQAEL